MSVVRIDAWGKDGRLKQGDAYFVYTAFAPMGEDEVLVKVGISTVPYERLVTIYCNCPFPVEMAAFVMVGRKKAALKVEREILAHYAESSTRGEWLRLPLTQEAKRDFASVSSRTVRSVTKQDVKWQRVTGSQIRTFMANRMRDKMLDG